MLLGFSGKRRGKAPSEHGGWGVHAFPELTQQLLEAVSAGRLTAEGHVHKYWAEELPVMNCYLTH